MPSLLDACGSLDESRASFDGSLVGIPIVGDRDRLPTCLLPSKHPEGLWAVDGYIMMGCKEPGAASQLEGTLPCLLYVR